MSIRIEGVSKEFDGFQALKGVTLSVGEGELLALLGSSGCGKTTLLRIIAGLIEQNEGRILIKERDISDWPPQRRNTALVFQNYALFPHMTLEENVAYGLQVRRMKKEEIHRAVKEALVQVELEGLNHRRIQQLSGGQKQRAALARALVTKPDILLFDEPLSNLDEKLRESMRKEIRRIQQETGITSIYVTHDQKEAMAIADRIAVMSRGEVMQWGTPEEIFYRPANDFTAEFMGRVNAFLCTRDDEGWITFLGRRLDIKKDGTRLLLPPEEVELGTQKFDESSVKGMVLASERTGALIRYLLDVEGERLYADRLCRTREHIFNAGETVWIDFDEETLHVF